MLNSQLKIPGIIFILLILMCMNSFAQSNTPVKIVFDEDSQRIDLITGRELPVYKLAQRGSIQFFMGRLDEPHDYVTYFKEGVNRISIARLEKITKLQEQFGIWRPYFKGERDGTPTSQNIRSLAVSFIPLSKSNNEPERRIYLLLNDLQEINWGN